MILYLAGKVCWEREEIIPSRPADLNILESFYYVDDLITSLIPHLKHFMLDSGAFTFRMNCKDADWNDYVDRYIAYVKKNKVKLYFEFDIDNVIGYEKVLVLRKRLEREVGWPSIPVWHFPRGKDEFLRMCDEYDYVAMGGLGTPEFPRDMYKYFPWFIKEAHKRGAKIHGLGFTNMEGLRKYHFDSVDSSSWTSGNRFGYVYKFDGKTLLKYDKPDGSRVKCREVALNNFNEWVKFCKYAETHL